MDKRLARLFPPRSIPELKKPLLDCLCLSYNLPYIRFPVTIEVSFLLRRLGRGDEGEKRGHPAPHQGALQAPLQPPAENISTFSGERKT